MKKIFMLLAYAAVAFSFNGYADVDPGLNPGSGSVVGKYHVYVYGALGTTMSHTDDAVKSSSSSMLATSGKSGFTSSVNPPFFYKMDVGYVFSENLAVEGGYLGTTGYGYSASGGTLAGVYNSSFKAAGVDVDMVGIVPVVEGVDLLVKIGGSEMRATDGQTSATQAGLTYGLGVKIAANDHMFFRADLDSYKVNPTFSTARLNFWSIGIGRSF